MELSDVTNFVSSYEQTWKRKNLEMITDTNCTQCQCVKCMKGKCDNLKRSGDLEEFQCNL